MERTDASSRIGWQCPVCGEGGTIEGWQGSIYDLSGLEWPDESPRASVVLEEADYRLLLDELADPDCERVLYAARPHPHGIELSATEDGLEHLEGFVAALANHAPSGARQRRWDAIAARLRPGPSGPRGWLEAAAEEVSEELASFGLAATPPQVAVLVHQRVSAVAEGLGITEASARRYLTDETLRDLARQTAFTIAEERPGADPIDQPREVPMTLNALGRTVAALAEAAQVRILNSDTLGADGAMQVVSLLGQLLHDEATPSGPILLPHAGLARAARLLEATAQLIRQGGNIQSELPPGSGRTLADAFAEDASSLRKLLAAYGTPPDRSTPG